MFNLERPVPLLFLCFQCYTEAAAQNAWLKKKAGQASLFAQGALPENLAWERARLSSQQSACPRFNVSGPPVVVVHVSQRFLIRKCRLVQYLIHYLRLVTSINIRFSMCSIVTTFPQAVLRHCYVQYVHWRLSDSSHVEWDRDTHTQTPVWGTDLSMDCS